MTAPQNAHNVWLLCKISSYCCLVNKEKGVAGRADCQRHRWFHTFTCCRLPDSSEIFHMLQQSVLGADVSQRPLTLHTVSLVGNQENKSQKRWGGTSPCKKGILFFICCLTDSISPAKRMQQSALCHRDWKCRVGDCEVFKGAVQPGSCASTLHSLMFNCERDIFNLKHQRGKIRVGRPCESAPKICCYDSKWPPPLKRNISTFLGNKLHPFHARHWICPLHAWLPHGDIKAPGSYNSWPQV